MSNYGKLMDLVKIKMRDCEYYDEDCLSCPWSAKLPTHTKFTNTQAEYKSDGKLTFCDLIEWGNYDE